MKTLYPKIEPYITHNMAVDNQHILMVEESGNPNGIPVIYLHGGPGSNCKPHHRCFFDPNRYRIILFDQRGAGRSKPTDCIENNTTQKLLADMETIRQQLKIETWLIFGGSWGATLGLLYAQQYPDNVLGLILRGVFLARQRDLDWFYKDGGVNRLFPQQWNAFMQLVPTDEDPIKFYYKALTNNDKAATLAWLAWSSCIVSYGQFPAPTKVSDGAKIEAHYLINNFFMQQNQILNNLDKIKDKPVIIIHGQRDLVCPLENAYLLAQNLPNSQLKIIPTGGHLAADPEMIAALVEATDSILDKHSH